MLLRHQIAHIDNPLKHIPKSALASVPLQKGKCSAPPPAIPGRWWGRQAKQAAICFAAKMGKDTAYLGMDFGTSGARATMIDDEGQVLVDTECDYGAKAEEDWAAAWERALNELILQVPSTLRSRCQGIALDGTSATAMLVDRSTGAQLAAPLLYNAAMGDKAVAMAKEIAPPSHTATASTSTLCKVIHWHLEGVWQPAQQAGKQPGLLHQADWLASLLHADRMVTDWNNALKLGLLPPCFLHASSPPAPHYCLLSHMHCTLHLQAFATLFPPRVIAPGSPSSLVSPQAAAHFGLPDTCVVGGGTTDSIAAFVAAGVSEPGQAVTSLGSTLAVKMLSTTRADDAAFGVYSHRLGDSWLVGGASNTGGAVLRQYFTDDQLIELTERIDPQKPTRLDYYPLTKPGERFPVNDPSMQPRLAPRPADDAHFLQGIFEGVANIEAGAYEQLHRLGAQPKVTEVHTAGGGAANDKWSAIRAAAIGVPVLKSVHGQASYGSAILARQAAKQYHH
ncbi:hypothetical protein DUNSADRAFT_15895 [Dunaliella salina]|uniref:Carbohydrate kinase FGGY C-terminal domain-containing protein n=1 Tax=Dunaliella salina TaxID=3046 RepID=A0ABQ7G4N5_DUNSA|nr:hypothetical protein DUNSADRAFT_15895 [Dunaliella salina]|eukprot:KAF5829568.1 hypothetical protein DUNSADRAFT_15895 [Dunaliella salina]